MSLATLQRSGRLRSPASVLGKLGFRDCYVQEDLSTFEDLIVAAGREVLDRSALEPDDVDAVFLYSGLEAWTRPAAGRRNVLSLFRYPAARIAARLGLPRASAIGLSQQGCSGSLSVIELAAARLERSGAKAVLCLAADALPRSAPREVTFNVMSDAAAAVLVERNSARNTLIDSHQLSEAYYWDTPKREHEIVAAYFPMAERAIAEALERAGLTRSDIRWFVPNNVSAQSWAVLADVLGIPGDRVWSANIARVGHTVSSDHVINLVDMEREGALRKGDHLLLFTFGFGASWSTLILRH